LFLSIRIFFALILIVPALPSVVVLLEIMLLVNIVSDSLMNIMQNILDGTK